MIERFGIVFFASKDGRINLVPLCLVIRERFVSPSELERQTKRASRTKISDSPRHYSDPFKEGLSPIL